MTATLDVIDSYLALDSTQYAQVPIGPLVLRQRQRYTQAISLLGLQRQILRIKL